MGLAWLGGSQGGHFFSDRQVASQYEWENLTWDMSANSVSPAASGWPIDTGPVYSKNEDPDPDTAPRDPDFVRILHDMAPRESGS